jgi:hypothetical protein
VENRRHLQPMHRAIIEQGTEQLRLFAGEDRRVFEIASQFLADERVDPIYTHPGLCLTVLPHRAIATGAVWERQTGYASLMVHPLQGRDGRMRGVPFGAKARLILIFLMTEAVRTRSRRVELGRSMHAWLKAMGVAVNGTNYRTVADQADRIEHCLLSFHLTGQNGQAALRDSIIRGSFQRFGDADDHTVDLSEGFYQTIIQRPVPLAEGAIRLLANTCMPLDLYLWLAYRLHVLERPAKISWQSLHTQFGAGTKELKHFKPRFVRDIRIATAVYPEAMVNLTDLGVTLHPSPPPIAPRPRAVAKVQADPPSSGGR